MIHIIIKPKIYEEWRKDKGVSDLKPCYANVIECKTLKDYNFRIYGYATTNQDYQKLIKLSKASAPAEEFKDYVTIKTTCNDRFIIKRSDIIITEDPKDYKLVAYLYSHLMQKKSSESLVITFCMNTIQYFAINPKYREICTKKTTSFLNEQLNTFYGEDAVECLPIKTLARSYIYDLVEYIVHYGDTIIRNEDNVEHKILDLYVKYTFKVQIFKGTWRLDAISGFRGKLTSSEYFSSYAHSHFLYSSDGFRDFCTGNSPVTAYLELRSSFNNPFREEEFEDMLFHIDNLIGWEDKGNPYRRIKNIVGNMKRGRVTKSRIGGRFLVRQFVDFLLGSKFVNLIPTKVYNTVLIKSIISDDPRVISLLCTRFHPGTLKGLFELEDYQGKRFEADPNYVKLLTTDNFSEELETTEEEVIKVHKTSITFKEKPVVQKILGDGSDDLSSATPKFSLMGKTIIEQHINHLINNKLRIHYEQKHRKEQPEERVKPSSYTTSGIRLDIESSSTTDNITYETVT